MFCQTFKSTISCDACIKRQMVAKKLGERNIRISGNYSSFMSCLDCTRGKTLLGSKRYLDRDIKRIKEEEFTKKILKIVSSNKKPKKHNLKG